MFLQDKYGITKVPLLKSRLFWGGVLIKLLLSCFFASSFLRDLFAPFANYFIESGFQNPYEYFMLNGNGTEFPYPPMMLWIFMSVRTVFWPLIPGDHLLFSVADAILYRVPLFVADLAILLVLLRWLKTRIRQVLVWYWLSPILIYINYFHGQLDVIPISLLFASLYFIFKNRSKLAFLLLALAIGCKTNIVLVVPFYFIYNFRQPNYRLKDLALNLLILTTTVVVVNLPYMNSPQFISMVYNNPVQQHVFDLFYQFNDSLRIYFIPSVYFFLIIWYTSLRFVNRDQLILFLAFTFLSLTLMVAPMQGWYYWIVPFLGYFAIKQGRIEFQALMLLTTLYFLYFAFAPSSDYHNSFLFSSHDEISPFAKFGKTIVPDIIFTLLQTTLTLIVFLVYKKGIYSNIQTKFLSQPYLIGIGGDSAAGKSTLTKALAGVFEPQNTSIIRGDDMHRWERGDQNWNNFTHLDPRANKLHEDMGQAMSLKTGKNIKRSFYDHSTGKFTLPEFIRPNKLIIFEGLHSFYLKNHSDAYDLKIFMEPQENLRVWWKVRRDVQKRGYTPEQVLEHLKKREDDSLKYIRTQALEADVLVSFFSDDIVDPNNTSTEPELGLKLTFYNDINLDGLFEKIQDIKTLQIERSYESDKMILQLKGSVLSPVLEQIAYRLLPELEEVGIYNSEWKDNYEGLLQLITVYMVFKRIGGKY